MDWPPNSPDLNPIEHIWGILKVRMAKKKGHKSLSFEMVEREWQSIAAKEVKKLVESMPRRLRAVIRARGGNTKY